MKTAIFYLRVSTDEQASRGYSLRGQQEMLANYCKLNNITVNKIFTEDHSAKTFKRPEWTKLIIYLRKQKTDLLLFTKWDRFSRNTCDAYQMLANLKNIGTNPQAIEQPLDLNIPENKLMLALYLAVPEIENDRRGLNTKMGIRRAKKEGNWSGKAPVGYKNKTQEDGRKYIAPEEPSASAMKWAFNELSLSISPMAEVYRKAVRLGLNCSINNFHVMIRNPVYCGKIRFRASEDGDILIIKGLHEPLITEKLFNKVQYVLSKGIKPKTPAVATPEELVLRGFLKCPNCHRMLTGSASKGRKTHVVYYHCKSPCKVRFNAKQVNEHFMEELRLFTITTKEKPAFLQSLLETYTKIKKEIIVKRKRFNIELDKLDDKIITAREMVVTGDIKPSDLKAIRITYEKKVQAINLKIRDQDQNLWTR